MSNTQNNDGQMASPNIYSSSGYSSMIISPVGKLLLVWWTSDSIIAASFK